MCVCLNIHYIHRRRSTDGKKIKIKNPHPNDPFVLFRLLTSKAYAWSAEEKCGSIKMEAADYFMVCGCNGAVK